MRTALLSVYSLGLWFYVFSARILSLFSPKAKSFIEGRKNILALIEQHLKGKNEKRIWFHFASLGEFEQGRPVMEQLKKGYPAYKIFITFFSPSGYSIQKNYKGADYIFYLPLDTAKNARLFLELVNPSLIVFVKYEFWLHYLNEIRHRRIPALLISAVFRPDQIFFNPIAGSFFASYLNAFRTIFLQNENSLALAQKLKLPHCIKAGDTRFDRVKSNAALAIRFKDVELFTANRAVLVAGSSWPAEEDLIASIIKQPEASDFCFIIVPHDVSPGHIEQIRQKFPEALVYSQWDRKKTSSTVLIIDEVGLLSSLYQYAHTALIGGGFGKGLHNILEAAVYGIPVLFGPNTDKFWEANALIKAGGALSIESELHFKQVFQSMVSKVAWREQTGAKAKTFIEANTGATRIIISEIQKNNWLT